MARPRREDRERAAAVHLRHRGRHGIRHIARILGLPKSTVHDWLQQGPAGILNPRLRMLAQAAVDRSLLAAAEPDWDAVRQAILAGGGEEAWFAEENPPPSGGKVADQAHTGAMVAFFLPAEVAQVLALDPDDVEGEVAPPEELHLTLAFLGQADELSDPDRLKRVVAGFAAIAPVIEGEISGVGRFSTGDRPVYASFDAPELPDWRHRLVQHLKMAGYPPAATHGFTPHVTLAYPEGPVPLDVHPLEVRFGTLTLSLGADRYDWPLEGSASLFAEYRMAEDAGAAVSPVPDEEEQQPVDVAPPIMDRLFLEAMQRYITAVANGTAHFRALDVARRVDPDFEVTDAQAARLIHALGMGDEPVLFAQAGRTPPPEYVRSVYEQFEFTEEQQSALADYLYELAQEGYVEGLNQSLMQLGQPIVGSVEDPAVLAELREEADRIAAGIRDTYDRDLARTVYTEWIELRAERGTQMSRRWLEEAVERWATNRASWKSEQIALTELNRWWNRATLDFAERNQDAGLEVEEVYVTPDECQCERCLDLVNGNPYTLAEAAGLGLPLHPGCGHYAVVAWRPADVGTLANLWSAQAA